MICRLTERYCMRLIMFFPLLLVMYLICPDAGAQTHYRSNVSVGIKGGADISRVFFNPSVRQQFLPGVVTGLMFRYIEENHFGIIAECNVEQRGWKEDFEDAPYNYSRTITYLQIPVLAHIYFGRRGRFFFNAGPEIGFCIGENTKCNFDPVQMATLPGFPSRNRTNDQMTMPVRNKIDYGISAGLGGEFSMARRHALNLEVRFYFGLGNIFSSKRQDVFNASNSMSLMATVGYWLRVK